MALSDDQRPLPPAAIEAHFGWKRGRLRMWRHRGVGPPVFGQPTPRGYVYRIVDVMRWLASRVEEQASEEGSEGA